MEQFNTIVNQNLGWVHENKYVLPVLSLFLGMYAALARPKLPNFIAKLFENPVFRLVVISYIIYRGNKDPQLSLMIAAAFLITMHMVNKQQIELLTPTVKLSQCDGGYDDFGNPCKKPKPKPKQCDGGYDDFGNPCKRPSQCDGGYDDFGNPC
jgi:hypothetical protein